MYMFIQRADVGAIEMLFTYIKSYRREKQQAFSLDAEKAVLYDPTK